MIAKACSRHLTITLNLNESAAALRVQTACAPPADCYFLDAGTRFGQHRNHGFHDGQLPDEFPGGQHHSDELGRARRFIPVGMTITKMRANPVDRSTREVEIHNGKSMRVLPRELRTAAEQSPFSSYAGLISRAPERRNAFLDEQFREEMRDKPSR